MTHRILKYLYTLVDSDFGWINFISGIMISASVNIFTGYCVTEAPSIYQLFASGFFLASIGIFSLYHLFNHISRKIDAEISMYNVVLSQQDHFTQRNILWKKYVNDSRNLILVFILLFIVGVIGLISFLCLSYFEYNNIIPFVKDISDISECSK